MEINKHLLSVIFLVLLTLQNSSQSLLTRYSRGLLKEQYSGGAVVLLSEVTKCVMSIAGTFFTRRDVNIVLHLKNLVMTSLVSSVPALIYFFQNILYMVSLKNINAELYSVLSQVKILSAAILSVLIIKKKLTWTQWRGLITLLLAVIIVEGASRSTSQKDQSYSFFNYVIGVGSCLLAATASGFSGVYMEMILKNKVGEGPKLNVWERNFQLSLYSIGFAIVNLIFTDGMTMIQKGVFHDFSFYTILVILIMSVGGILVALVMTYADVIVKGFSVSVAIICTTIGSFALFGTPITLEFCLGAIAVLISISNYNDRTASYSFQNPEPLPTQESTKPIQPVPSTVSEDTLGKITIAQATQTTSIELLPLEDLEDPQNDLNSVILEDIDN